MSRLKYENWAPSGNSKSLLRGAVQVCDEYAAEGYDLTLRQLYYQFVARGWIPNSQKSYKRLGDIVNRGRMAGYIDWDHITDRTRNLESNPHWESANALMRGAARGFGMDLWENQDTRVEVWVEKEALAGVVERVARRWDCAYFSCRGYVSQSEQWAAGQRIGEYLMGGQNVTILHLGDHDPSGIDMTRDIYDRITTFLRGDRVRSCLADGHDPETETGMEMIGAALNDSIDRFEVRRIALNWDQVEEYEPPPNPAKLTDSRAQGYVDEFGYESWELDALDPRTLDELIEEHVEMIVDQDRFDVAVALRESIRDGITELADRDWGTILDFLESTR